jgi:hypothetical protein
VEKKMRVFPTLRSGDGVLVVVLMVVVVLVVVVAVVAVVVVAVVMMLMLVIEVSVVVTVFSRCTNPLTLLCPVCVVHITKKQFLSVCTFSILSGCGKQHDPARSRRV